MLEREPGKMLMTDLGWALESDEPTHRRDLFWVPTGTAEVWGWDGDGWYRLRPPERVRYKDGDLPHG